MAGFHHPSQTAIAAGHRSAAPDSWHDLKRDWQRWSRGERVAAECLLGLIVAAGAAYALTVLPLL